MNIFNSHLLRVLCAVIFEARSFMGDGKGSGKHGKLWNWAKYLWNQFGIRSPCTPSMLWTQISNLPTSPSSTCSSLRASCSPRSNLCFSGRTPRSAAFPLTWISNQVPGTRVSFGVSAERLVRGCLYPCFRTTACTVWSSCCWNGQSRSRRWCRSSYPSTARLCTCRSSPACRRLRRNGGKGSSATEHRNPATRVEIDRSISSSNSGCFDRFKGLWTWELIQMII